MTGRDDDSLATLMRQGLQELAAEVDVSADPAPRSAPPAGGRWRRPAILGGAAAAAVLAIAIPFALRETTVPPTADPDPAPSSEPTSSEPASVPTGWRAESYGEVSVRVPPTWGWGGGPMPNRPGQGDVIDCGSGAYTSPRFAAYEQVPGHTAYAGRPVMMTDACGTPDLAAPATPTADFVLLGSLYDTGVVDVGDGFTSETVTVSGQRVTVVTRGDALRARIIDTIAVEGTDPNGCATQSVGGVPETEIDGWDRSVRATGMSLCVYEAGAAHGPRRLLWSSSIGAAETEQYDRDLRRRTLAAARVECRPDPDSQQVVLRLHGVTPDGDPAYRQDVVRIGCGLIHHRSYTRAEYSLLVPATIEPWASGGTLAYVVGDGRPAWSAYFRGILG